MMIPGSNLLAMALGVIGSQTVQWFQYDHVDTGPTGLDIVTYKAPVPVAQGSVQAVDRSRYTQYGLDWQKSYVTWFVPNVTALSITRNPDTDGDVIEWAGRRYQVVGDTPWSVQDHWTRLLCIDIGPATGAMTNA
jgi:hypothetical protein